MQEIKIFKLSDATHAVGAGAFIFRAGEAGNCAFVLLEGEAEVLVNGTAVERSQPGDLLGEMALIECRPRSACARAATDCKLIALDERRFLFLVQQHPFFALQVMKIMAERLRHMNRARRQRALEATG
jgi:CRP-like cAMP-binding protein